jgi:hypothetical protein
VFPPQYLDNQNHRGYVGKLEAWGNTLDHFRTSQNGNTSSLTTEAVVAYKIMYTSYTGARTRASPEHALVSTPFSRIELPHHLSLDSQPDVSGCLFFSSFFIVFQKRKITKLKKFRSSVTLPSFLLGPEEPTYARVRGYIGNGSVSWMGSAQSPKSLNDATTMPPTSISLA